MSYEKQNFENGQVLKAEHLNKMEDGIKHPDWNDLTDKPFYEEADGTIKPLDGKFLPKGTPWIEESDMVEILPDYTINSEEDMAGIPALGLVAGNTYIVKLQGTEYTCVAWEATQDGMTAVGLGDIYTFSEGAMGSAPTGEPFVLIEFPPEFAAQVGMNVQVQPLVEMTFPVVFSISGGSVTVHKLDNRCLDLDWLPAKTGKMTEIIPIQTISGLAHIFTDVPTYKEMAGDTYAIDFGGQRYNRVPFGVSEDQMFLGNAGLLDDAAPNTGEPFVFWVNIVSQTWTMWKTDSTAIEVAVYAPEYSTMPPMFLPPIPEVNTNLVNGDAEGSLRGVLTKKLDGDLTTMQSGAVAFGVGTYINDSGAFVSGRYNSYHTNRAHIVGNGTAEKPSDAYILDWDGNAWFAGDIEAKNALILSSPNGTRYKITVADDGTLSATAV